jgi:uncharacterized protein
MKIIQEKNNKYVLRFGKGESFLEQLEKFLKKEKILGGWFWGIGALTGAEIAYYDLEKEKYLVKKFKEKLEVLSLTGNIAMAKNDRLTHAHIVLGRKNFSVIGGHLVSGSVGGTLEVLLDANFKLSKKLDKKTGLSLLG